MRRKNLKRLTKWLLVRVSRLLRAIMITPAIAQKVPILLYHEIAADNFAKHVGYLNKNFTIISLAEFKTALYGQSCGELPANALVITFDDGWRSNFSLLPVIRQADIPVTIFLTVGLVGTHRKIWNYTIDRTGKDSRLNEELKLLPNQKKDSKLYEFNGHYPEKEYVNRDFLSFAEIDKMKDFVEFQSHGMFHPIFTKCTDAELRGEMVESKKILEEDFGFQCDSIAYPYGLYGEREIALAKSVGYMTGRSINKPGLNSSSSNPFSLKAIGIGAHDSVEQLQESIVWAQLVAVEEHYRRKLLRWIRAR